eukprot:CAMPEP_0182491696 /NCGR_PEP_ID=MMETSP1321-20130603/1020_1 /TAXON_ID=91990 /ORGANISM="Bolidomonas sp., Strain RCC1657" /LENGTH=79 /DNA_ID=CAMNT_0024693989 /DNA_START=250 /DNA_END=489 /DNA_ORIENTATION=-
MEEHVTRPASLFYEGGETLCIRAMSTEGEVGGGRWERGGGGGSLEVGGEVGGWRGGGGCGFFWWLEGRGRLQIFLVVGW